MKPDDLQIDAALEGILMNQDEKMSETNDLLEKVLEQTADNNTEDLLEKQLLKLDEISEQKTQIVVSIDGAEVVQYKGEQGEKGDEPTDERLIKLIKPLIPNVRDGKDADKDKIVDEVLSIVLPEIPTAEEVAALIPKPKDGRDGFDANEAAIVRKVLAEMPKPEAGERGQDGSPDTPEQVKEKILKVGIKYDELSEKPDIDGLIEAVNRKQSSKTVSLKELDDVDLSNATVTNGKYVFPSGGTSVTSVNGETGVVVLDTGDISEVANKKYVTNAEKTVLSNTSGVNTGDQDLAPYLTSATATSTYQPLDPDLTTIAGLTATTDNIIQSVGGSWASRTPAQVKTALSLSNVDNTADTAKPVSTAQQTALNLKADLASPTFTGNPTAPTPTATDNDTSIATTAFVQSNKIGYTVPLNSSPFNPIDGTTYYFGGAAVATSLLGHKLVIPKTGTIKSIYLIVSVDGTLSSGEDSSVYLRLNNTTDTTISTTVETNATSQGYNLTNQSIAVTAGDYLTGKVVFPTFVTNPTVVSLSIGVYVE